MTPDIASGGNVIAFPKPEPRDESLAVDVIDICGNRIGSHLTEWGDVALFVEHHGEAVGGLMHLSDAIVLRDGLSAMIDAALRGCGPGAA